MQRLQVAAQKDPEARLLWTVIVPVDRNREIRTSTNTSHEHEFTRGDRTQRPIVDLLG